MKQKKRNRLLALVVTLVLIVGLMPGEAAASTPDTKWTDYAADSFAGGSGTKDDPYQIATAEQLAKLAVDVNANAPDLNYAAKYFILTENIDLSAHRWIPIGSGDTTGGIFYNSYFDGNEKTITGLYVDETSAENNRLAGLFGGITINYPVEDAVVKNLTISGATINTAGENSAAGILAGSILGDGIVVENCHVSGVVAANTDAGGMVGYTSLVNYDRCTADVEVAGAGMAGGFVGNDFGGSYENCSAKGAAEAGWSLGGFAGFAYGNTVFKRCMAAVSVTASDWQAGGFIGYMEQNVLVTNCVAYGDVKSTVTGWAPRVGGFAGANGYVDNSGTAISDSALKNCHAYGKVVSGHPTISAGGFIGYELGGTTEGCSYNITKNPDLNPAGEYAADGSDGIERASDKKVLYNICEDYSGHNYGEWDIITQPDYENPGQKKHTCIVCGAEETVEVDPLEIKDLDLSKATEDLGNLDTEGYHWDVDSKTLTLKNSAWFGNVILPDNYAVTVVTSGENHFSSLSVEGEESYNQSYKMDIAISGSGKLTVEDRICGGMDGDALTVDYGAELVANEGISIGASGGVNSTVNVKGKLSANAAQGSAIYVGKVVVGNTGELHVSGTYGVTLNGMIVNDNIQYDGVFTIEDDGAFYSDCSIYAIGIFTNYVDSGISDEEAAKMIVLPDLYLPLDYEVRTVKGPEDEHGSQYAITIAREDADLKIQDGELVGAASCINLLTHDHALTYVAAMSKTCTENGHTEYWECNTCGRIYRDENGTTQIKLADTVISASHELRKIEAKVSTCTEAGNIECWICSACGKYFSDAACTNEITEKDTVVEALGHDFSGDFDAYDENGHWHICNREGCGAAETPAAHNFTNYVYNNDATYFADGTETAVCDADGCEQTSTRVKAGTMLNDATAPTGEIKVEENSFKAFINTITFGIFCRDKYDVTITGKDDETGIGSIEYYISETAFSKENIEQVTEWKEASAFGIADEGKYIIYAKITDKAGNVAYISTDGMVIDKTLPVIGGLTDGKTYCEEVHFTVEDENIDYVTVNGEKTTDYVLKADGSTYEVKAVDKAGNESLAYSVTVKNGHITTYHEAAAATCTEAGNIEYWTCSSCGKYFADAACTNEITEKDTVVEVLGHDFSGDFDAYDENGHWHICHREGCDAAEMPAAHNFTNYVYNNDATYFVDGTETAVCDADGCEQTSTRVKAGTMLNDATAPTGEIKVEENSFKAFINTITFGIFCRDKYDVTITGKDDETGIGSIEYYVSETAFSKENIEQVTEWKEASAFGITDEGKYIIYARITDKAGNVTYISTDGMVIDKTLPVIGGLTDGKTYCEEVHFTVEDENIDYVTVNGEKTTDYVLKADGSTYEVKAVDKAGNESLAYRVTVKNGHITTYHEAAAATCVEAGNIEYWICSACGKYFADAACTNEITEKDTVVEALGHKIEIQNNREATCTKEGYTGDHVCTVCGEVLQAGIAIPKLDHSFEDGRCTICGLTDSDFKSDAESVSPQTGDSSNSMTWIVLLLTVSGIVFLAALSYRKKDC